MKKKQVGNNEKDNWGLLVVLNLYNCDSQIIRSANKIREFVIQLCDVIDMKRYGGALIERFGKGELEGFSVMQFIETSSITAHFDEFENRAFIDIFSCKNFDPKSAVNFCCKYFKAHDFKSEIIVRK